MNQVENGDVIELYGVQFKLSLVSSASFNERTVSVFYEHNDDELETTQDHFTVQVYDIDEVTSLEHGLSGKDALKRVLEISDETFNG